MKKFCKYFLIIAGSFLILYTLILMATVNINIGIFVSMFIGIPLFLYGIFYNSLSVFTKKGIGKALKVIFVLLYIIFISFFLITVCFMCSSKDSNMNKKVDALIILGAGLKEDVPSATLARRLDKGIEYYNNNKDVVLVVSGGNSGNKSVSEAQAMKTYLIKKGIPQNVILLEDKSKDTNENFALSLKILNDYLKKNYSIGFATSDFHGYRSELIAKKNGFIPAVYTSSTTWYYLPNAVFRECFSILKEWIFG